MPMQFMFDNQQLKTWLLLHQTYNNISKCEDIIFARAGLTTQQHTILMAIKFMDGTATPSRISQWTDRNISSVTMITNRMEKEGLVERVRDKHDRRFVGVVATEKGRQLLDKATVMAWGVVQEILSVLSEEELHTLNDILERIRRKAYSYSNPDQAIKGVRVNESQNMRKFMDRVKTAKHPTRQPGNEQKDL